MLNDRWAHRIGSQPSLKSTLNCYERLPMLLRSTSLKTLKNIIGYRISCAFWLVDNFHWAVSCAKLINLCCLLPNISYIRCEIRIKLPDICFKSQTKTKSNTIELLPIFCVQHCPRCCRTSANYTLSRQTN